MSDADVIVVGAGVSGLKAAQELVAAGRSVIVLEGKDRVGGRLKRAEVAGRAVDLGGQWVGAGHDVLCAEAKRLGIETYKQYHAGETVVQLLGKVTQYAGDVPKIPLLSLIELALLQRRWDRDMKTVPAAAPWTAPRAQEWDGMTLESWIVQNIRTAAAREFARIVPRGAWAVEARQVSYLWFMDALRSGTGLGYLMGIENCGLDSKFKGGMHQIAQRLADELGARLVLNAPVLKITQSGNGVRVMTDNREYTARFVIVAGPPGPMARIAFEPHLPAARDGLHQRMPQGAIIKAVVAYKDAFWRTRGFSGQIATDDDVLGLAMDDWQEGTAPTLLCFIEGRHALEMSAAGKDARKARIIASLIRLLGPEAASYIAYEDNDWLLEPYTHGYVGSMPPGVMTRFGHALREPCGRIHWAGTETAEEWAGYIEGGMRSGIRAAREVIARHNE
ncbi:MAG TPA: FAD-dependent oxidoreductase [Rhizomicrobium sp.]|nr:FAD-dependent oxidoreductase [Rhizomicrobium sp.]